MVDYERLEKGSHQKNENITAHIGIAKIL